MTLAKSLTFKSSELAILFLEDSIRASSRSRGSTGVDALAPSLEADIRRRRGPACPARCRAVRDCCAAALTHGPC
jgi:hypothetical protein